MGTNYYAVPKHPTTKSPIHIGKSSIGWQFLFQTQHERWNDPPVVWDNYNECRDWLHKYTVENPIYVILDEYDEVISFDDFFKMVERKQDEDKDNPDNFRYANNINGYRFSNDWFV